MKRPSAASLKRVTAENLARLGADRLAEILLEVADTRVELKRRLRMELAAEQGAEHLLPEIDRRLSLLANSRGAVSWRQRPAFARDLEGVRGLISGRLADLDRAAAEDRILAFSALSPQVSRRVRDKEGAVDAVFKRAAADATNLYARSSEPEAAARLATAIMEQPGDWSRWAEAAFSDEQTDLARRLIGLLPSARSLAYAGLLRRLADIAGDTDLFHRTFTTDALALPSVAALVSQRYLRAGRLDEARAALEHAVRPGLVRRGGGGLSPDPDWESAWIEYLERAERREDAQTARWASFERTLSVPRLRDFLKRLDDFDDVEAEAKAFAHASVYPEPLAALAFLMGWPALGEAAGLITGRSAELRPEPEDAEAWARKLRRRHPIAAETLLRRAAAEAFRRRAFPVATRLTEEADAIAASATG